MFRPEFFFALSSDSLRQAVAAGIATQFLYLGVDGAKFRPASSAERARIRAELHIPNSAHVILHVGHWGDSRNLGILRAILQEKDLAILVMSSRFRPTASQLASLKHPNLRIVPNFVHDIEKYFQSADLYVSPVIKREGIIEQPLSVLEAITTDLPVVGFPVGGMRDLSARYGGVHLASDLSTLSQLVARSRVGKLQPPFAHPPGWGEVATELTARIGLAVVED